MQHVLAQFTIYFDHRYICISMAPSNINISEYMTLYTDIKWLLNAQFLYEKQKELPILIMQITRR